MTARAALRAAWARHALLSPLAIMLLFFFSFKEHFYAKASPGSRCDPFWGLDPSGQSYLSRRLQPLEEKKKGEGGAQVG